MALTYTPYSQQNQEFSNRAHMKARQDIYPLLFKKEPDELHYPLLEDAQKRDYDMGIDRTIGVDVDGLRHPLYFSVQERFRRPNYAPYRDMTITGFNHNSDKVSEIHKIVASLMTYGYFNADTDHFIEVIVCRMPVLLEYIVKGSIPLQDRPNPRTNQTFYCFHFDDLLKLPGVVKFYKRW